MGLNYFWPIDPCLSTYWKLELFALLQHWFLGSIIDQHQFYYSIPKQKWQVASILQPVIFALAYCILQQQYYKKKPLGPPFNIKIFSNFWSFYNQLKSSNGGNLTENHVLFKLLTHLAHPRIHQYFGPQCAAMWLWLNNFIRVKNHRQCKI